MPYTTGLALAQGQTKSLYLQRYDADITILTSGDFRVIETQELVYRNSTGTLMHFAQAIRGGEISLNVNGSMMTTAGISASSELSASAFAATHSSAPA